jgi:hypothetical protein
MSPIEQPTDLLKRHVFSKYTEQIVALVYQVNALTGAI